MKVIEATNVRDAYVKGLDYLQAVGIRERSRAGDVLVSPVPVTTIYEKPMQRVLLDPQRDANPTFHLLESMWMLAGRNDAAFLNRYVKTFGDQFGEMDGTIHDAYGHRWRKHFGFDQLAVIIDKLQLNRGDRQCVLQMWDATDWNVDGDTSEVDIGANDLRCAALTRPCNTHAFFRLRDVTYREPPVTDANTVEWEARIVNGTNCVLDLTLLARSNDMIFGGYGANAVHFSMMQEYVARMIGCAVGRMYQVSNNFHAYVEVLRKVLPVEKWNLGGTYDGGGATVPLIDVKHTFDDELRWVLGQIDQGMFAGVLRPDCSFLKNKFLSDTVVPMAHAYEIWSQGTKAGKSTETGNGKRVLAYNMLKDVMAPDWRRAAMEWMERRLVGNQSA